MRTEALLSTIRPTEQQIFKIIRGLNSNKAHGHDGISVTMLKISAPSVVKPLNLIFSKCLLEGIFPSLWKLANVQPVHKKSNRQVKSNYRPISLLRVCGIILEKIVMNYMHLFKKKKSSILPPVWVSTR